MTPTHIKEARQLASVIHWELTVWEVTPETFTHEKLLVMKQRVAILAAKLDD